MTFALGLSKLLQWSIAVHQRSYGCMPQRFLLPEDFVQALRGIDNLYSDEQSAFITVPVTVDSGSRSARMVNAKGETEEL